MGFDPLKIISSGIQGLLGGATSLIDEIVTSDEERAQLKNELERILNQQKTALIDQTTELFKAQRDVVVAEARGDSWLQRSWRPITMLVFVFIIASNYVIAPYVAAFGGYVPTLEIPNGMWALLNVGIGGYIASRGVEKVVRTRNGT